MIKKYIKLGIFIMISLLLAFFSLLKFTEVEYRYEPSKEVEIAPPIVITAGCFYLINKNSCETTSPYKTSSDRYYIVSIRTISAVNYFTTYGKYPWKEEYYCYNQKKERILLESSALQDGIACSKEYEEIFQRND